MTRPTRDQVEAAATKAAEAAGVPVAAVLGVTRRPAPVRARKAAWLSLISRGYSVIGTAFVWGCDRKSIQRVKREAAIRVAAE